MKLIYRLFTLLCLCIGLSLFVMIWTRDVNVADLPFDYFTVDEISEALMLQYGIEDVDVLDDYTIIDNDFYYDKRLYDFMVDDVQYECIIDTMFASTMKGEPYIKTMMYDNYGLYRAMGYIDEFSVLNEDFNLIKNDFYIYDQIMLAFNDFEDYKYKVDCMTSFFTFLESKDVNYPITIKFVHPLIPLASNPLIVSNIETVINGFDAVLSSEMIQCYTTYLLEYGMYYVDELRLSNGNYSISYNTLVANPSLFVKGSNYYYDSRVLNCSVTNLYEVFDYFDFKVVGTKDDFTVIDLENRVHHFKMDKGDYPFHYPEDYTYLYDLGQYDHPYSGTVDNVDIYYFLDGVEVIAGSNALTIEYLMDTFGISYFVLESTMDKEDFILRDFEPFIIETQVNYFNSLLN